MALEINLIALDRAEIDRRVLKIQRRAWRRTYHEAHPERRSDNRRRYIARQIEGGVLTQNQRMDRRRRAAIAALKDKPCADCEGRFPSVCMDFDHRPGTQKAGGVGSMLRRRWAEVLAEIEKCDVVCANCHRIRTHSRGQHGNIERRPS